MASNNQGIIGLEIRAMRRSAEQMMPYQRQDCPVCAWPLEVAVDAIIHCRFCGFTDQSPLVRQVERP